MTQRKSREVGPAAQEPRIETVHVGRQPIVGRAGELYGYELLFRDQASAGSAIHDGDSATTATITAAFSEFGADVLLGGRRGFVNLSRNFITGELPLPFEPATAALEMLETIQRDAEAVSGVQRLAAAGYEIVLDDFDWTAGAEPLLDLASIVKIDVLALSWDDVLTTIERCRPFEVRLLAEKVEDAEMLQQCLDVGFELFQGYHLGRPETRSATTLSPSQTQALHLLGLFTDEQTTVARLEEAVLHEPALMYRLLRIANSAAAGLTRPVSSIQETLILVGRSRLRAWLVLLSLSPSGGSAIGLTTALVRARMCEGVARRERSVAGDVAFTAGLLDGLAESLGLSTAEMPTLLPFLTPQLVEALAGVPGPLQSVLSSVRAYENGAQYQPDRHTVPLPVLAETYLDALAWTTTVTRDALA